MKKFICQYASAFLQRIAILAKNLILYFRQLQQAMSDSDKKNILTVCNIYITLKYDRNTKD